MSHVGFRDAMACMSHYISVIFTKIFCICNAFSFEAAVVGVGLAILGVVLSFIGYRMYGMLPTQKALMYMAVFFFVLGFLFHVVAELFGVNQWYCNNGHACKNI